MKERENKAYKLIRFGLVVSLFVGLPVLNHESTCRVFTAFFGGGIDPATGEAANSKYPYDVIAVPGAGYDKDEHGNYILSADEEGRLNSAAKLYVDGYAPFIILLDGGAAQINGAGTRYLQRTVEQMSDGKNKLPASSVFTDDSQSDINTATNMQVLQTFMLERGLKKAVLTTDKFHSIRVELLARNYNINSDIVTVEDQFPGITNKLDDDPIIILKEEGESGFTVYDPGALASIGAKSLYNEITGK